MRRDHVDLSSTLNQKMWADMLDRAAEGYARGMFNNDYESEFVKQMMKHDAEDRPIWNPSVKQWNLLHTLTRGM